MILPIRIWVTVTFILDFCVGLCYARVMVRAARIVVPGMTYHVTQQGNNKQVVFFAESDKRVYLDLLHEQGQHFGFRVDGYCLMANHVHIIGVPAHEDSLAKGVGRTNFMFAQYIHREYDRSGHFWQNRFFSCPMDEVYTLKALCYVEQNPVRAGIVKNACAYPWSSAAAHCGVSPAHPVLDLSTWHTFMPADVWREILDTFSDNDNAFEAIRRNTRTGRPLGSDSFLDRIEHLLGRRVRPLPVGRPRGSGQAKSAPKTDS